MKIIIYKNPDADGLIVSNPQQSFLDSLEGTEEEKLKHAANQVVPTGQGYEIIDDSELPDYQTRDSWRYIAGENEKISQEYIPPEPQVTLPPQLTELEEEEVS